MVVDRLREAGTLGRSTVEFHSALGNVFGVKAVNDNVLARWDKLGVGVTYHHKLTAVDIGGRRATFSTPEGAQETLEYDFLHVVPP